MGLFKKRSTDPSEIERLKAEISAMKVRIDATDEVRDELGSRVQTLATQIDEAPPAPPPSEHAITQADIDLLRARIQRLSDRLDTADASAPGADTSDLDVIRGQIEVLTARLDTPIATPPPPPPPSGAATEIELGTNGFDELNERIDALRDRLEDVDVRITSISTELANQISELSSDLERFDTGKPVDEHIVDELRDAQTRLANEQARYQIAFREDLADLLERLKRG